MIYNCHSLYTALRAVIVNMPDNAVEIDIRMRASELPEMRVTQHVMVPENPKRPLIVDDEFVTQARRFVIVPLEDDLDFWAEIEKLRSGERARRAFEAIDLKYNLNPKEKTQ